jgi:hypothetical protein
MDDQLKALAREYSNAAGNVAIHTKGDEVRLGEGEKVTTYRLKAIPDLYGKGINHPTLDPEDQVYTPLLQGLEMEIRQIDDASRGRLTDAAVLLALSLLAMNPEASIPATGQAEDVVALRLQTQLRLILSLNDYSRQDVKQAIRRITKSAEGHSKTGGPRGYLAFIRQYVR